MVEASNSPKTKRPLITRKQLLESLTGWAFIIPAMIVLGIVVFVPILEGVRISFLDYTLLNRNNPTWNNFSNYIDLFESGDIQLYFKNTFVFVTGVVVIQFVIAFVVAQLLNSKIRGRHLMRGLFLLPWTVPTVVVALLWVWLLQPQYGVINYILGDVLKIVEPNQLWTQHPQLAMVSVMVPTIWRQMPLMMVLLLAALQSVPTELREAAQIDGATELRIIWHVVMPLIRPVIGSTVLLAIINNFQMFVIIFSMTGGGPVDRTTTLSIGTYDYAFTNFNYGAGAAIGVLWLVALIVITVIYNRFMARAEDFR